jgi:hypothetical protein
VVEFSSELVVVFWIYVGLFLAVPPFLWGLGLAVAYLYVRWRRMGFLARSFKEKPRRAWWW